MKTLEMTRLSRRVLLLAPSNKYTFHKVVQVVFSLGFASAKCTYFCKL